VTDAQSIITTYDTIIGSDHMAVDINLRGELIAPIHAFVLFIWFQPKRFINLYKFNDLFIFKQTDHKKRDNQSSSY
jgi:hypothetical protein